MKGKIKILIIIFAIVLIFMIIKSFVIVGIKNTNISSSQWKDDVNYLDKKLTENCKSFPKGTKQIRYRLLLKNLLKDIHNLNSDAIQIRIMEILASIGDGHVQLLNFNDPNTSSYPIQVYWFQDGYYVVNASEEYKYLIGKKLIGINKENIFQIVHKLSGVISKDNEYGLCVAMPSFIEDSRVLKAYKITNTDSCIFQFEDKNNGRLTSVSFKPQKLNTIKFVENPTGRISLIETSNSEKLNYIKKYNTVYFRFDYCKISDKLFSKAIDEIKEKNAKNFIIDLRNNEGGSFIPNNKLISGCKAIRSHVKIYTIIGRKTFSSGIDYSASLKKEVGSIFYGEPTSGKPNGYGEVKTLTLPNSKLIVQYSSKFFKRFDSNKEAFSPDIYVYLSIDDYLNNNDAVLNKVLKDIVY